MDPGVCGCGASDNKDSDGDGKPDCNLRFANREELIAAVHLYMLDSTGWQPINTSNVSLVTDMLFVFDSIGADGSIDWKFAAFNGDVSAWDVSQVTSMVAMFQLSYFNQALAAWDVSRVTDMGNMFYGSSFHQPIAAWNVSSVTDMNRYFPVLGNSNNFFVNGDHYLSTVALLLKCLPLPPVRLMQILTWGQNLPVHSAIRVLRCHWRGALLYILLPAVLKKDLYHQ